MEYYIPISHQERSGQGNKDENIEAVNHEFLMDYLKP